MLYFVAGTLIIFTLVSILYQFGFFKKKFERINKLRILPNYSFFAPNPFKADYRLLCKVGLPDEGSWVELKTHKQFNLSRIAWNPSRYYNKAVIDACRRTMTDFKHLENKNLIKLSSNYIVMLSFISDFLATAKDNETIVRFAIVSTKGLEKIDLEDIYFFSFYHKI